MTIDFRTGIEKQLDRERRKMSIEFTAESAKKLVSDYNNLVAEKSKIEFLSVVDKIKKEAKNGEMMLSLNEMSDAVKSQLKQRGFLVESSYDQRDGSYCTIYWN